MKIVIVGLNHKTAPLAVRERLAFNEQRARQALTALKQRFAEGQFVILSTCNRVELYCAVPAGGGPSADELAGFLAEWGEVSPDQLRGHLYIHQDERAVRHLLTVACSLDSMVVGESQIIGQVKESYRLAVAGQSTGKTINRLFHCAFATSKEVYTTTSIAQRRVSVAGVAAEQARRLFDDLRRVSALVIGAGDMGQLLIRHLLDVGCRDITVVTRSRRRANQVADRLHIAADDWDRLDEQLVRADIVVAAAGADAYLYDRSAFAPIARRRRGRPLLIIDIAVPRNFDPAIHDPDGVFLYCVDDLAAVVAENLQARQEDLEAARQIVEDNVASFMDWFGVKDIGPLVGQLRDRFQQISSEQLQRFFAGDPQLSPMTKRQLETLLNRTVNKLLHHLVHGLYQYAKQGRSDSAVELIRTLLDRRRHRDPEP